MKKPEPRAAFLDESDEREHEIDRVCRAMAELYFDGMAKDHRARGLSHGTVGELADTFKEMLGRGEIQIELDETGNRFRLVPGAIGPEWGNA